VKEIAFTSGAVRQWRKLTATTRAQIDIKLTAFAETGAGDVKALKGVAGMRLRAGDWRVLFTITANNSRGRTPPRYLRLRGHHG
jgi:mRNA interferase RelE/StbE